MKISGSGNLILTAVAVVAISTVTGCQDQALTADVIDGDAGLLDTEVGFDVTGDTVDNDVGDDVLPPEFDPVLADSLNKMLQEHLEFSPDPGLTLTIGTSDGAWWTGAAGFADLETGREMLPDSQFRVGSNTKPIVAVLTLQLVEEELINLDESLSTYLPQYSVWSDITVRMLLNMRSGLRDFLAIEACLFSIMLQPEVPSTPAEVIQFVLEDTDDGRDFPADTDGAYTNTGYVLLGMIVEAVTGNTFEQEIKDRVLDPLKLEDTYLDSGDPVNSDLVEGYINLLVAGAVVGMKPSDLSLLTSLKYVDGLIVGTYMMHPTVVWSSGAMVSTSYDMARFVKALMTGKLLSAETMDDMIDTQPALLLGGMTNYGLGLQNIPTAEGETWGHGGLNFGYKTQTWYVPEHDITVSHIHNYLVNFNNAFQNDVVAMVKKGGDADYQPCLTPDDFYGYGTDGPVLNLAFNGAVNSAEVSAQIYGVGNFHTEHEGEVAPLVGLYSAATAAEVDGVDVIRLVSYGVPATGDADLEMITVQAGTGLFEELSDEGTRSIAQANSSDMFVSRSELYYGEDGTTLVKNCFTGFTDVERTGTAFLCPCNRDSMAVAGDILKFMATLPLSEDPTYIETIASTVFETTTCTCNNDGIWGACAE